MAGNKNSGRKPMPIALKMVRGNPGRRPIKDTGPKVPAKLPPAPKWLSTAAKTQYTRQGKNLVRLGILKETDSHQWAIYCQCWQQYIDCVKKVESIGVCVVARDDKGRIELKQNQYMAEMHKLIKILNQIATQFGMTPQAREALHVQQEEKEISEFARLLNGT